MTKDTDTTYDGDGCACRLMQQSTSNMLVVFVVKQFPLSTRHFSVSS
jgi:hypothetical protein